jgi:prepilin-type N-terminal cleavage/methylation domain-containing protein
MLYEFLPESRSRLLRGFTLAELLAAMACLGILAAIASPSFLAFRQDQELSQAQGKVHHILHQGRNRAMRNNLPTQVSFRKQGEGLQWSIHPVGTEPMQWETLGYKVGIDGETTLRLKNNNYGIQFNHYGEVNGQLGRITLSMKNTGRKRCVMVSSLIGAMRDGETHSGKKSDNKTCF